MFKQKGDPAAGLPKVEAADAVQQARSRARHRLIGAIVLLAVGIIGFPLVFETQPRPVPIDIPIEIPRRDAVRPLVMPPPRSDAAAVSPQVDAAPLGPLASSRQQLAPVAPAEPPEPSASRPAEAMITESQSEAGRELAPPRAASRAEPSASRSAAGLPAAAAPPARRASAAATATRTAAASSPPAESEGDRARALLEARPVAAVGGGDVQRFVVQVGAFADAEAARETRRQVDKLGLKTYTQVAQTAAGNRIRVRVGPFASRAEAEAALAKAKAAGVAAVVLTL